MTAPAANPLSFDAKVAERRLAMMAQGPRFLTDAKGHPVPPAEVVKRLPKGASIKWVPAAGFYGTAYFALFKAWPEDDPRWGRVRSGEYPREDARDLVQMFPPECSPYDMAAYVEQRWGNRITDPRAEADRLIAEAMKLRQQAEEEAVEQALEVANEHSKRESVHALELRAGVGTANAQITVPRQVGDGPKRLF